MFSWYDYIIFIIMLGLSILIGIYFGCFGSKQSTVNEYLMGNRNMEIFPITLSLIASHISGFTLLAVPTDVFKYGASYILLTISVFIASLLTIYIFLPVFFKLQITSVYEYLGNRFDGKTRMFASFLNSLAQLLYLPIVIYIPSLAFSTVTGYHVHLISPLVCTVCVFYTTIGGLKAVVWTDTVQFSITISTVLVVFYLGVRSVGGIQALWLNSMENHLFDHIIDFDLDPTKRDSFWIVVVGQTFYWLPLISFHQCCIQKFLSVPTIKKANYTVILYSIGFSIVSVFSVITGLIVYAKYSKCDPFKNGTIKRKDQLVPYYIQDISTNIPGLSGLFIAGIFCAALSTLSANLNCLAGNIYEDFLKIFLKKNTLDNGRSSKLLKIIVLIIGIVCTLLVFIIERLGGLLPLTISMVSVAQGPLSGMFMLGILYPRCKSKGAFYGSLIGFLFTSFIVIMEQYYQMQGLIHHHVMTTSIENCTILNDSLPLINLTTNNITSIINNGDKYQPPFLFRISFYYYTMIGTIITIISSVVINYFDNTEREYPVHRDFLSPIIYSLLPENNEKQYIEYRTINKKSQNNQQIDTSITC